MKRVSADNNNANTSSNNNTSDVLVNSLENKKPRKEYVNLLFSNKKRFPDIPGFVSVRFGSDCKQLFDFYNTSADVKLTTAESCIIENLFAKEVRDIDKEIKRLTDYKTTLVSVQKKVSEVYNDKCNLTCTLCWSTKNILQPGGFDNDSNFCLDCNKLQCNACWVKLFHEREYEFKKGLESDHMKEFNDMKEHASCKCASTFKKIMNEFEKTNKKVCDQCYSKRISALVLDHRKNCLDHSDDDE